MRADSTSDDLTIHVAAYVEDLGHRQSAPTVKQHLATIRCFPGSVGYGESATGEGAVQKLGSFCTAACTTVAQGT